MTEEQKQKRREANKRYRETHKAEERERKRKYRAANKDKWKEYTKRYREKHRNEIMRKMRERVGYEEDAAESIAISAESKEKRRRDAWIYERYEQETAQDIASRYYNKYGG